MYSVYGHQNDTSGPRYKIQNTNCHLGGLGLQTDPSRIRCGHGKSTAKAGKISFVMKLGHNKSIYYVTLDETKDNKTKKWRARTKTAANKMTPTTRTVSKRQGCYSKDIGSLTRTEISQTKHISHIRKNLDRKGSTLLVFAEDANGIGNYPKRKAKHRTRPIPNQNIQRHKLNICQKIATV